MTTTPIRAKFKAEHAVRASHFAAKADIRYYLNGLHIEAAPQGGVYIIGCDGHTLAVIYDATGSLEGDDGHGITIRCSNALLTAATKAKREPFYRGTKLVPHIVVEGSRVYVAPDLDQMNSGGESYIQPGKSLVEGKYPDWRRVLPPFDKLKPGMAATVQSAYIARYQLLSKRDRYSSGAIAFWQAEPQGPVVVQHESVPEMISIVMPMCRDKTTVFTWAHLPAPAATKSGEPVPA